MYHTTSNNSNSDGWSDDPPQWFSELPEDQVQEIEMLASIYQDARVSKTLQNEPMIKLVIEGENVTVTMVVEVPKGYPTEECARVSFRSLTVFPEVLQDIQQTVQDEANDQFQAGTFAMLSLLGRASELVSHLPLSLQASDFCCCVHCNSRLIRQGKPKAIQPAKLVSADDKFGVCECLCCHDQNAIHIPTAKMNVTDLCTFCYCEDNPLVDFECGCRSCTTCFKTFADIATGSNSLKKHPRTKLWGVSCPNHISMPITDGGLLKLMETRGYLRFNKFALERIAEQLNGYWCPLPGCNAAPICSDVGGGFMKCKSCRNYACTVCFELPTNCTCTKLSDSTKYRRENQVHVYNSAPNPLTPPSTKSPEIVQVMLCWKSERKIMSIASYELEWAFHLMREMEFDFNSLKNRHPDTWPFFVLNGTLLKRDKLLSDYAIYNGSLIYAIEFFPQRDSKERLEEEDLWSFRRNIQLGKGEGEDPAAVTGGKDKKPLFKNCPSATCNRPVFHYRNHGCHHIGVYGGCCKNDWCFACRGKWPCTNGCKLFCWDGCDCPPCPDCKPKQPCVHCAGCDQCELRLGEGLLFE